MESPPIVKTRTRPRRPAFRYYGAKWRLAPEILKLFPPHGAYLEPCFGSGAVLAYKPPSKIEIVNDINGRIVNFFRVLRERPNDLVRLLNLTPYARDEFEACIEPASDPLEEARRFYSVISMARSRSILPGDQRRDWRRGFMGSSMAKEFAKTEHLLDWAARLKGVQIENEDALDLIERVRGLDYLIYFDPPYLKETRVLSNRYAYETTEQWHRNAAELLNRHDGPAIVSGYPSKIYKELYEGNGWSVIDFRMSIDSPSRPDVIERLWLSPNIPEWNPRLL